MINNASYEKQPQENSVLSVSTRPALSLDDPGFLDSIVDVAGNTKEEQELAMQRVKLELKATGYPELTVQIQQKLLRMLRTLEYMKRS